MRKLVNLSAPCDGFVNQCAGSEPAELGEVVYGAQGEDGIAGQNGAAGANGMNAFTTTASPFFMPPVGAQASVQVVSNGSFSAGQLVYIAAVGYFEVTGLTGTTGMSLRNLGGTSTIPVGALIGAGLRVTSGAQPGPDTAGNEPKRYAIIAQMEDMGEDGGGLDIQIGGGTTAMGYGTINHLEAIHDPDNIVGIEPTTGRYFTLPVGSWKIRARVPGFYSRAFQAYIRSAAAEDVGYIRTTLYAVGNGYAGMDADLSDGQSHAIVDALIAVTDPELTYRVDVQHERWSFGRAENLRDKARGVASNF